MKNEIGFFKKVEITLKLAIRNKPSFSLRVARVEALFFAHGFINEALFNPFKVYAFNVFFSYGIFGMRLSAWAFLGGSLLHLKKTRSNKTFSLPKIVKRAAKATKNKKAETCCLFLIAAPYFKKPYFEKLVSVFMGDKQQAAVI